MYTPGFIQDIYILGGEVGGGRGGGEGNKEMFEPEIIKLYIAD